MRYGRIGWGYENFKIVFFFLVLYGEFKFELKNSLFDRRPPVTDPFLQKVTLNKKNLLWLCEKFVGKL